MLGYINKIIPFSSVDGPGNRTAIFLQGCNFNCVYCHNPETINHCFHCKACVATCKSQALNVSDKLVTYDETKCVGCDLCIKSCSHNSSPKISILSPHELMSRIMKYRPFIQGITVSGGECMLQADFLVALFELAKLQGLTCFIDTNGSIDFSQHEKLLNLCDGVMLDVKVWDLQTHQTYIGSDNLNVIKNLEYLTSKNKLYEVRTVVVPELFDNVETVKEVATRIQNQEIRYKLIKFRNLGVRADLKNHPSPTNEVMSDLENLALNCGCSNVLIV